VVFGIVRGVAFILGYTAGEAAKRRGDARVFTSHLPSWRPEASWASRLEHPGILFSDELSGFRSPFRSASRERGLCGASAFVDVRQRSGRS
jgi:hypothetical protein